MKEQENLVSKSWFKESERPKSHPHHFYMKLGDIPALAEVLDDLKDNKKSQNTLDTTFSQT